MKNYKEYIGGLLKNRTVRFKCDCIVGLDVTGKVVDYKINKSHLEYIVSVNNKIIHIDENTPNMFIDIIS